MVSADGLLIDDYRPRDNDEALALELACSQGHSYRLSFRRTTFHRRAHNFTDHRIIAARLQGRLAGLAAMAFKDVVLHTRPLRASFVFDLRVHPDFRGHGIAKQLCREIDHYCSARSDLRYAYTVADHRVVRQLASLFDGQDVSGYAYLVYPAYRKLPVRTRPCAATLEEVHTELLRTAGPFDFYTNPLKGGRMDGHVASWMVRRGGEVAGCSVWDNREILSEVVQALPLSLRMAGSLLRSWPLRSARWPHLPRAGERLRSWYLFDLFATDSELARDLLRHISLQAQEHDIDYCYLPHHPSDRWVKAVRSDLPALFAPLVPYRLLVFGHAHHQVPRVERIYVDVRDL